jgi:hypothetical protein
VPLAFVPAAGTLASPVDGVENLDVRFGVIPILHYSSMSRLLGNNSLSLLRRQTKENRYD